MRKIKFNKQQLISIMICILICILVALFVKQYWDYKNNKQQVIQSLKSELRYDIEGAIKDTYENLSEEKAKVIEPIEIDEKKVAFIFQGGLKEDITHQILDTLRQYQYRGEFFFMAKQIAENEGIVNYVIESGNSVGSLGIAEIGQINQLSIKELVENLSISHHIISTAIKESITLLRGNGTDYTNDLLRIARASGYQYIVESTVTFNEKSFKTYEGTLNYIKKLKKGSIIAFSVSEKTNTDQLLDIIEWTFKAYKELGYEVVNVNELYNLGRISKVEEGNIEKVKQEIKQEIKQEVVVSIQNSEEVVDEKQENLDVLPIDIDRFIKQNNQQQVEPLKMFLTTQKAVAFTFRGIGNERTVKLVLDVLDDIGAKGTFFVTKNEVEQYPETIRLIVGRGHEIGNGGITAHSKLLDLTTREIIEEIYICHMELNKLGIQATSYMPGYGYVNESIKEAESAIKGIKGLEEYECVTYTRAPILTRYKGFTPEQIAQNYLSPDIYPSLRRGDIVFFRMDSDIFENQADIADIIRMIAISYVKNGNAKYYNSESGTYLAGSFPLDYELTTINELAINKMARYEIMSNRQFVEVEKFEEEINEAIKNKYIGNLDQKNDKLIGFDDEEREKIDIRGTIKTDNKKVIFLTFDDWGSDAIVNSILNVLEKYQVKATFFIIGKNIDLEDSASNVNPNLLRAIGEAGHDIGSHTNNHSTLDAEEVMEDRVLEIETSRMYNNLYKILDGLDCVRSYLRPPELVVSKKGLVSAFKAGYEFVVSGNFSTHDYEVESAEELLKIMNNYLEENEEKNEGNIFIMHMNDQSVHTAAAIDLFISQHQDEYEFAKLSDYLNESYEQGE